MLCHKYKCLFVHIPKTAGQSIEHVFLSLLMLNWTTRAPLLLRPNNDPHNGPPSLAHLKASEYVMCNHITQEQFDSYFKFSFVRNPWDRIVSEYKYRGYPKKFDFKTYLFKKLPEDSWSDIYRHIIPQYDFLFDDNGNLLVDFIGYFENLQKDFDEVCRKLGIPVTLLPFVNKSLKDMNISKNLKYPMKILINLMRYFKQKKNTFKHYTEYYDDESKEFVSHLYRKDIETFKYKF
ncbi:MAG TPA: hypothetical protein DD405_00820 [Desulfobacteraceae bacterium]|nr:hypothetical protein [Desulfobacteraceae bacterium]